MILGDNNLDEYAGTEVRHTVSEVRVRPDFRARYVENDIALLRLTEKVTFSKGVRPACLPEDNSGETYRNRWAVIAGWGNTIFTKGGKQTSDRYEA